MTNTDEQVLEEMKRLQKLPADWAPAPQNSLPAVSETGKTPSLPPEKPAAAPRKRVPSGGIASIVNAIAQITSEVGVIPKKGHNRFHNYKYAAMQDVLQQLTPIMGKHGVVIFQTEVERSMLDQGAAVAVTYEFTAAHVSGDTWPPQRKTGLCRCRDSKGGFDDKAFNKCSTAARKYYLLELFQIATDEEEADAHESGTPAKQTTPWKTSTGPSTHRADTGDRYDVSTGEIIPAAKTADEKGKGGAAAQSPPEPKIMADDPRILETAKAQLAEAAKHGMRILEIAWLALPEAVRRQLKPELGPLKEIAAEADKAKQ